MISELGIIVLAGGLSTRMGTDKTRLPWGSTTLLGEMLRKAVLTECGEILVSINRELEESEAHIIEEARSFGRHIQLVPDTIAMKGPLSGLQSALSVGTREAYIVVSADMPWFSFHWLPSWEVHIDAFLQGELLAMVPYVGLQEYEPLAAIYKRSVLDTIQESLEGEDVSMHGVLDKIPYMEMDMIEEAELYSNVNTRLSYKLAKAKSANRERSVPIVTISASQSKSGKTAVATSLINRLSQRGIVVGMVKSDGHGFSMDQEGTDTWKASQAGAKAVAIAGPNGYAMVVHGESMQRQQQLIRLANEMPVDLVLLESRSHGVAPIIEVVRANHNDIRLQQLEDIVAVVTDIDDTLDGNTICEQFSFSDEDMDRLADWILKELL
ncbi:molybdopterin-guanine dinucleotide biosynthesis protein MobB [Veillonella sp. DNF00869]|jgi:tetraacyldisaccharide-1-P 4'-kinase|uniref:molybdopterin-guanine dinucleotide biosynthesis protein MobB n=1 Tax=Veillonella sp. DNF00869 TaxID=1384081 RepID=UPI0007866320|nr:molybdopterin-guanine dinucleotide biosynthesis protein MobB [Veillonella sp. DNF00869]KXB88430.1 Molybdopterin guanine dinucleotide synthesis protein B [Veillonella sp. DNF00869]